MHGPNEAEVAIDEVLGAESTGSRVESFLFRPIGKGRTKAGNFFFFGKYFVKNRSFSANYCKGTCTSLSIRFFSVEIGGDCCRKWR